MVTFSSFLFYTLGSIIYSIMYEYTFLHASFILYVVLLQHEFLLTPSHMNITTLYDCNMISFFKKAEIPFIPLLDGDEPGNLSLLDRLFKCQLVFICLYLATFQCCLGFSLDAICLDSFWYKCYKII